MALMGIFGSGSKEDPAKNVETTAEQAAALVLSEEQREFEEQDIAQLGGQEEEKVERLQKEAVKEVQEKAEESIIALEMIKHGRCPKCGGHLSMHTSANVCEECGWNKYDIPKHGKIKLHLTSGEVVEGERAYVLKDGYCLLTRGDVVYAKVPRNNYSWVEYQWTEDELEQRRRAKNALLQVTCGWCGQDADVNKDGFHLVHIAFGSSQERYCFCCDECYEAFRKMYPSRVHRNCYETNCNDCNLCMKRYGDEAEGIRDLAKDRIRISSMK